MFRILGVRSAFVSACIALLLSSAAAQADPVTYRFNGTVLGVNALGGDFNTSMLVSGEFTYESSTPAYDERCLEGGCYRSYRAVTNFFITIGSYTASAPFLGPGQPEIRIFDNWFGRTGFTVFAGLIGREIAGFRPLVALNLFTVQPGVVIDTILR